MGWQERHSVVPAVYMILRRDNNVFLIRRANTGYMDGKYSVPSGHLDGGESALAAACREAKEEVGVDVAEKDLTLVHTVHRLAEEGDHERIDLFFAVSEWCGEPHNAEPEKCDDASWFNLDNLPENIIPMVRQSLKNISQDIRFSAQGF